MSLPPALLRTLDRLRPLLARLRRPTGRELRRGALGVVLAFVAYVLVLIPFTPGIGDIRKAKVEQPARVLSADGKELAVFKWANREWVGLADISPQVTAALIATEDHRFYEHHGIDFYRLGGAMLRTFSGDKQGGSTLTQQLARNLFPDEVGRARSINRKLKEAITALKIEAVYSKDEILETYLNTVPFLYNAWGIEMAARTYFDKPARRLDVLEAATLVGMLKGNSYYNPVINPERAVARRNTVLAQMVKRGKLDEARLDALQKKPLRIDFERQLEAPGPAPHFAQQVRKWLIGWADRNDYNIYADGLVVRTTIDARLQAQATQAVIRRGNQLQGLADQAWAGRKGWAGSPELVSAFIRESKEFRAAVAAGQTPDDAEARLAADKAFIDALRRDKTRVQVGFVAIDPRGGQVRAWVGSRDFVQDPFDHVQQARRQPGSTFKPFVYGAAFDKGMRPDDTLIDQPVDIPLPDGERWQPTDEAPPSGKPMTLRDGLVYSRNRITAQLVEQVGADRVAKLAKAMGVRQSPLEAVPSLALGTSPVTLREMVAAYTTIASGGEYREPMFVARIEDRDGYVLAEFAPAAPEKALDPAAAWTLLDVMRGVVDRGTGVAIRNQFGLSADLAGKTGTTQDNTDGWFILMHPQLVGGAWVGFNDNRITLRSDYWGQGAKSALPIVGDAFHYALRNRLVDGKARFVSKEKPGFFRRGWNWVTGLFASAEPEAPPPEPRRSRRAARPETPPAEPEAPPVPVAPAPDWTPPAPPPDEPVPPRPAG
ncbi:MAG: transglycosylase domain-containing protein [Zoogloea sp.]|nr:transglycosylase domain-containing protein [Zoogloea sp.]